MGAKSYFKLSSVWRKGATLAALVSLLGSTFTFLDTPPPAEAAVVSNNLVLNLDANNTASLAATSPTGWNSVSPATSTATSTFFGNAARVSDATGASLSFDGTGDAAVFPAGTARTAGAMTLEAWIKPGNLRTGWNVFASRWFPSTARGGSAADQDWHLAIYGTSTSNLKFQLNTGAGIITSATTFPATSANKWYHLAVTIDAANTATLWVNGVAETTSANFPHTDNATAQLHIGDVGDATQNSAFNGNMSRFRIYNTSLSSAQIAQNYLTDSANYGYAPANTVAPSISGTAKVGTALTTPGGTWGVGDADGTTTTYQWQTSANSSTWTNISGATSASYTPVAGDATNYLRVSVTKTNSAGSATATSSATLRVQAASGTAVISGGKLTGLTSTVPNDANTYNVTLATNNLSATMLLGTTTGLTVVKGYASTASYMASTISSAAPIITFRGSGTAINTALANVSYTSSTQQVDVVKLYYASAGAGTDTKDYIPIYDNNQLTFHYYAYKWHASGKNRADMDASVAPLTTTDGVEATGPWYLSTPRYQVEWDRIKTIVGQNSAYMGARADAGSANWYWPANTDGYSSATIFGTQSGSTVTATSNIYNQTNTTLPFHAGEPNAGTADGRSGFFYISNSQLGWDDVPLTMTHIATFTMETYGTAPFAVTSGSSGVLSQTVSVVASHADAPNGFTAAAAGTGSIVMGWNSSSANTTGTSITGYRMEASTTSNFSSVVASSTSSTNKAGMISGLATNTLYYVRVMATTSAGNGAATSPLTVTTTSSATTITVVSSGGGTEGTDYSLINGYFVAKSGFSVSINASAIQTALGSSAVNLAADNVVINAPITWNVYPTLTIGNTATSTVAINKSITANSAAAWIVIPASTYSLDVASGASINFPAAGTSNRLYVGGALHTVLKTEADLATIVAGGKYALGKSLSMATSYTTAPINLTFTGTLDGLGNTIDGMKIAATTTERIGLISTLATGGVVRNLGVTNVDITLSSSNYRVGAIAGGSTGGTMDQVWSTGFIRTTTTNSSLSLGGLVGNAPSGTLNISKSWSSVNIDSSTSGSSTALEQGGIIGGDELTVPQVHTLSGGSVNLSQVYATGTLKWASSSHRGIGGIMGLKYSTGTTAITDAFSWVTFASGSPTGNLGGVVGVAAGGTTTVNMTYQTTASVCVASVEPGWSANPNCTTKRTPGETVAGISGANWTTSGPSILKNLAAPAKPLYVQVVAPTDGSYATVSYQIVDGAGAVQNTAALSALSLSVSGTPVYKAAGAVLNGSSAKATYSTYYDSGLTLGGSSASYYSIGTWRETTSVTISKFAQTVTWAPTASVDFGNGTLTPSATPTASGGTTISYSVSTAGTTGCSVNSSTGVITYTSAGTCTVTATAASAGDYLAASTSVAFVIGAAPTLTVVATGGGTAGTDFVLSGGVLSASANASINASYLTTQLASGNVTLAGNVVVSAPITWSGNYVLTLGGTSTNTISVNSSITASGNSAGLVIKPSTYSLSTKDGAAISLSGTNPTLSIGGNSYTLIKSIAELSNVTATAGTFWALAKPLSFSTTIDRPAINVAFAGTLDGLGNTVENMRLTSTANLGAAFIKNLNNGTVRNLGVTNLVISLAPTVTTNTLNSGGLIGDSAGGTLDQVWTSGNIRVKNSSTYSSLSAGGLVGDVYSGTLTINKSWSSLSIYGWNSTFTNAIAGGLVGGNLANWSATSTSTGGNLTISQSYATGDIAIPLTSGIHGYGGIVGVHLGTSAVSVTDVFSWSQISINSGAKYGGIFGNSTGSTAGLQTAWTTSAQAFPSGAAVSASNNTSVSVPLGTTPGFTTNANWYQSTNNRQLVNLPMAAKNLFVKVGAPTNGAYGTLSYSIINGVEVPQTPSSLGITVSGTPTYSIDSDVAISATPYSVTYVSGLEFAGTGTRYSVSPFLLPTSVTISKYSQSISFGTSAPTTAAVGATYTPTATSTSALSVVFTIDASSSSVCTISNGVVTFNALGDCVINANQAGNTTYLAAAQVQQTAKATVKGTQTVSFTSTAPSAKVNGSTYTPTGTATSGLSSVITVDSGSSAICSISSGVVSFAANGSCVLNINQAGNANWNPATQVQQTIAVGKGDQTITFSSTAPTSAVVSGSTYTPTATATSAGVVAFTIDAASSAVCSISSGVVSFQAVGTCKVLANQAGNTNWNAATQIFQSFSVGKGTPTLAFTSTAATPKVGTTYTPAASSASTGAVTYTIDGTTSSICSIASGVVTFNAVGTCKVNAAQAADTNWVAVTQTQQSITVVKGDQTITFSSTPATPKVNSSYTPVATSTSGGAVVFTIDSTSSSVCTISLGIVIFSAVGSCKVNANQAGGTNWNVATQAQQVITVLKGDQTVTISSTAPSAKVSGATYTPSGTSTSGVAPTFTIDAGSGEVCSITAGVVSFLTPGSCVVNANEPGGTNWNAAAQVQQTITVAKGDQTVTFTSTAPTAATVDGATYTPTATKTAGTANAITFTVDSTASAVCSVSDGVISFTSVGTCKVNANVAGDDNYNAASQVQQSFTVAKGSQVIAFTSNAPNGAKVGGSSYTVVAAAGASTSAVTLTVDSNSTTKCSVSGMVVTYLAVGDCVLNLNQAGDTNYLAATQVQQTVTITADGRCPNGVVSGNYCLIRFNTSGSWTVPAGVTAIDMLAVGGGGAGGGGGGGNMSGGGGGGGEVIEILGTSVTPGTRFTITVGAGGVGGGAAQVATASTPGSSTTISADLFTTITSRGGGQGGTYDTSNLIARPAGTGTAFAGGGGAYAQTSARGNQAGVGGVSTGGLGRTDEYNSANQAAGGGGGAGGNGGSASTATAGTGGAGKASTILGQTLGGGGGGGKRNLGGSGGLATAGGGNGGIGVAGIAGVANTGGGGGGSGGSNNGGNGGSGVVVIRIALQSQAVSFTSTAPTGLIFGTSTTYTPAVSGTTSELPATITVDESSASVCSIEDGEVSIIGAGTCTLNANQDGNGFFSPADQVQQSFEVAKQDQTISFTSVAPTAAVVAGSTYTPTATSTSDGLVAFTIDPASTSVCSITLGVVSFQSVGTCKVLANQAGDDNWNAATENFQSFVVAKGTTTLAFSSSATSPKVNTTYTPVAASSGTGAVSYAIDATSSSVCSIEDGVVSFNAVGTCKVNASQVSDTNWLAISLVQQTITVLKGDQSISFTTSEPSDAVVAGTTYTPIATATSADLVELTIDEASSSVCSIEDGVVSFDSVGTCKVLANQAGNANWDAAAESFQSFEVGKGTPTLAFTSTATSPKVNTTYTPAASSVSTGAVSFTIDDTSVAVCSISNGVVSFEAVGSCKVNAAQATDANWNAVTQVQQVITVIKGDQSISFASTAPMDAVVGGATYTPAATSTSDGLVVFAVDADSVSVCSITSGVVSFLAAGECVLNASQAGDDNWNAAVVSQTIDVGRGVQVVEFTSTAPSNAVVGGATYSPTASRGDSGNAVTFRVDINAASVCAISNGVVRFVGVGTCLVNADQVGDANYLAAGQVQQSFTVGQGSQVISFTSTVPVSAVVGGTPYTPTATGGATGKNVVFSVAAESELVCELVNGEVSFLTPGDCVVAANQAGNTNYLAANETTQTIAVAKGYQTISFASVVPANAKVDGNTYEPVVTSGPSEESVVVSIAEASSSVCSVTDGVVSFTGVGDCVIYADQSGDSIYEAATRISQTVSVAKGLQVVTFTSTPPSLRQVAGTTYIPTASSGNSGLPVVFAIAPEAASLCEISNGVISFLSVGDCVVYADQAGNDDYTAATRVSQVFDITKGEQVIAFTSPAPTTAVVGGSTYSPSASRTNGTAPVVYSVSELSSENCSVTGGVVSFEAAGTCIVIANQAGDERFNAATPVSQTFLIGKGVQTIMFGPGGNTATVSGNVYTPVLVGGLSVAENVFTIAAESSEVCSFNGTTVSFQTVGDCVIEANRAGDANYLAAESVTKTISVTKGTQATLVANSSLNTLTLGGLAPTAVLSTTGGSGTGEVVWSVNEDSATVCSISGEVVTGLTSGYCDVTATKLTDTNYLEATATVSIAVSTGGQAPLRTTVSNNSPTYAPNLALTLGLSGGDGTGAVWFESLTPLVCSTSGTAALTVLRAGECVIVGHKDGDVNFEPGQNTLTFTIAKATQPDVDIEIAEELTYSPDGPVTSQLSFTGVLSGGIQEFSVIEGSCQLVSDALSASEAGTCVVEGNVGGDVNYLASSVQRTFTIAKAVQENLVATVEDGSNGSVAWAGQNVTRRVITGGSGTANLVATTSTPTICSVTMEDDTVVVTGLTAGTCAVTATKASDTNYLAQSTQLNVNVFDLPAAPQTFTVTKAGAGTDGNLAATVTWVAAASNANTALLTGYEVQTRTANSEWATVENGVLDSTTTTFTVEGPAWSQLFIRVAPISALDSEDDTTRNWVTLTEEGSNVEVPFDLAGELTTISTTLAAVTSGEVVTLEGTGFDPLKTTRVQITTGTAVFTSSIGRAAAVNTKTVAATVLSPTKLTFVLPKITMPKGRTTLPAQVQVLTVDDVLTEAVDLTYIPKKLTQTVAVTGLPATKSVLNIANGEVSGIASSTGVAPQVTATPANVCTASIVNGEVEIDPIGRGTCTVTVKAPATPGYTVSTAKTYAYTIQGATQNLSFTNPGPQTWSTDVVSLVGTATLNPVFTSKTPTVCTTSGSSLTMVKAGLCSVVATQPGDALNEPATVGATKLTSITQSFTISKKTRTTGLTATLTDVLADGTKPERTLTYLDSSIVTAPNISVVVGDNPLELPVRLNRAEGTVLFTVASADASRCLAEPGSDDPTLALITVSDLGSCKVTITLPADERWNAHADKIVIWINAIALPDGGTDPTPTGTGDGQLADQDLYFDNNPLDKDSDPAVLLAQTGESVTANLGGDLSMAYDAVTGKYQFRSKTLLVGKYTAKMTGPAGTAWFAKASTITQCTKVSKGKCVKSIKVPVTLAVNECVATLTVKKDPKLKKRVLRIIGAGCQLNDAGKAAFNETGVQNIIFKYQWIRQYPSTGLDHVKKGKTKVRFLKKVKRTVVLSVGRPAN